MLVLPAILVLLRGRSLTTFTRQGRDLVLEMSMVCRFPFRDHPFKTSACLRGGGVSPIADVCRC